MLDTLKKHPWKQRGKSKILINAVHEEWVGPQTCATSVQSTYTEGLVLWLLRSPAKPTHCGRKFQVFSTLVNKWRSKPHNTHLALSWISWKCVHGDVGVAGQAGAGQGVGAWSKLQQTHEQTRVRPLVKLQASARKNTYILILSTYPYKFWGCAVQSTTINEGPLSVSW